MPNATITADQLRTVFMATELGGNAADLTRFSYAEKGSSTYSFGLLQFDVGNNAGVQTFLKDNGFSSQQISELSQQGGLSKDQLKSLDAQLQAIPQAKLDQFTDQQLGSTVTRVDNLIGAVQAKNPAVADAISKSPELQLALADYDNQFSISGIGAKKAPANGMLSYLEGDQVSLPGGKLQLGSSISRADIQNYINATDYGRNNPTPVKNREANLEGALNKIEGQQQSPTAPHAPTAPTQPTPPTPSQPSGNEHAATVLKEGAHGTAVHDLQAELAKLGYTGSNHKPLTADGDYGPDTKRAVESFQRDHHLKDVDGKAGPETLKALDQQVQAHDKQASKPTAPGLADQNNPDHALYQQALDGVRKLDAAVGRTSDQHSANLAASLVVAAKAEGLTRIDTVAMSADGTRTFAAQNTTPLKTIADVPTMQGMNTPMEQSSAAARTAQAPAQNPNQAQGQDQTQARDPNAQQPAAQPARA